VHAYRESLSDLRRQWRRYAAGRAWLATRYPGFTPEPAVRRALPAVHRSVHRALRAASPPAARASVPVRRRSAPLERAEFLAIDVLLAIEELVGLRMSNRVDSRA
jgi:hypothetical protein